MASTPQTSSSPAARESRPLDTSANNDHALPTSHSFQIPHSPPHTRRGLPDSPVMTLGKAPVGHYPPTSPYTTRSVPGSPHYHHHPTHHHHNPMIPLSVLPRMPFLTPDHAEQRKAMEAAASAERQRAKELEIKEAGMSLEELRLVLKRERQRMGRIAGDLAAMRTVAGHSQLEAEVMEEGRVNSLMRKMNKIQEEKGRIILELESEEEMLTNKLQKKLDAVRAEKRLLEHTIEQEKLANEKLRKQLKNMKDQYVPTADALEEEDEMEEEE
ncbi:hypothetical protein FisN_4Lh152 [Fistulifera solaris]|uniref:Uncharacterized protein n=1 Tax=Fistulifera solaris TaxID=1519565 RepID=A0A1Z5JZ01_FISSO|nr:hypothetical protein FisN_4Lh152 [Fistulifera solaris]|eukprot:GAX19273.1 hypothetical protein FisN_4Lh152 [Fistulifera solaris]